MKANESGAVPVSHPLRGGGTRDRQPSRRPSWIVGHAGTDGTVSGVRIYIIDFMPLLGGAGSARLAIRSSLSFSPKAERPTSGSPTAYPQSISASSSGGAVGACPLNTFSKDANKLSSSGRIGIHASCCVWPLIMTATIPGFKHRPGQANLDRRKGGTGQRCNPLKWKPSATVFASICNSDYGGVQ